MLQLRRVAGAELAWCMSLRQGEDPPELLAGRMVETTTDGFFAGVWDGPFEDWGFPEAYTVMGTGGRVTDEGIHFCAASHPVDGLYTLNAENELLVSNSLPLILATAGDSPDPLYRRYRIDFADLWRAGRPGSPLSLPTARGRRLDVHLLTDLVIGHDLEVKVIEKPLTTPPQSFDELRLFLGESVHRLVVNGADPARQLPLRAIATISSGFDSTAAALLAVDAGVTEAATFVRQDGADSGTELARRLGMNVTELDVEAWRADPTLPEIDFSASAGGSLQISMAALARFRNAMVFTGHLGDLTWTARNRDAHDGFAAPENFSFDAWSQHDFQLRVGIVAVHVPAICGFHGKALGRISCSDEMKQFHLGSPYERPIARRILEERGVPRDSFGIRKYHGRGLNPTEQLSDAPRRDFDEWWRAFRRNLPRVRRWSYRVEAAVVSPSINVMAALLFRLGRGGTARRALRYRQYFWSVPGAYRFHWAVERLIEHFRND